MDKLPWHNPRKLLQAWTPADYEGFYPPYINVTQVGSMCEFTLRGPTKSDGEMGNSITIKVNVWTLNKFSDVLKQAANDFESGFEDRIYEEHTGKTRENLV